MPDFAFGRRSYEDEACGAASVRFEYPMTGCGRLWVDSRSAMCGFLNPAAADVYKWMKMDF